MKNDHNEELVLVAPAADWMKKPPLQKDGLEKKLKQIARSVFFVPRALAESDETVVQIIPYVVFSRRDNKDIFVYRRTKVSGEKRLRGKWSVGIGGHINPADCPVFRGAYENVPFQPCYDNAMAREIKEEVSLSSDEYSLSAEAILHDITTPVGRVHLGIVHFALLPSVRDEVSLREDSLSEGRFVASSELKAFAAQNEFEPWSDIVIKGMLI